MTSRQVLDGFIPIGLVERLEREAPSQSRFDGAALFADISGYTELTETLLARGEEGLGELSGVLDRAFGRYVELVHIHGGEVVHFAGDALLAYWPREPSTTMAQVTRSAVQCAEHLVAAVPKEPDARAAPQLHVGVDCGSLWVAHVDGDDYAHLLFGGCAARGAIRTGNAAKRGESLASERAKAALAETAEGSVLPSPAGAEVPSRRTPVPLTSSSLARLVPRIVIERAARDAAWAAELRHTTSLFVGIAGIDGDSPAALETIVTVTRSVHDALRPFSSSPGRWLLDDKGLVFVLIFGVPFNAHKDDNVRALRAAMGIASALEHLGTESSIGVASGTAFCGPIGAATRREYVTVGRPLNLAARLMGERRGLLYAGTVTGLERENIALSSVAPLRLKGFAGEVHAHSFRAGASGPAQAPKLHGRKAERFALERATERLLGGSGGALILEGEAGLGKSSLVADLALRARDAKITSLVAENTAAEHCPAFVPWRQIFGELIGARASDGVESLASAARTWLADHPHLSPFAPLLGGALRFDVPENDATRHLEGPARAASTIRVLSEIVDLALPRPALIVLEDAHWMDPESWRLALEVAQRRGVLVVVTMRPGPRRAEEAAFRALDGAIALTLGPLEVDAVAAVTRDCLESRSIGGSLAASVHARSAGNPLVAIEYIRLLRASQRAVLQGDHWVLVGRDERAPESRTPVSVRALLTSRVDHLTGVQSRAVKAAAAIGGTFSVSLLREILAPDVGDLTQLLSELASHQIIEAKRDADIFAFRHDLFREVVHDLMLPEQRRALHAAIARALEGRAGAGEPVDDATLAHHWSSAGDVAQTMRYADSAGVKALHAGAYREAIHFIKLCVEGSRRDGLEPPDPLAVVRWHRQLADAHHGLGELGPRRTEATRVLEAAGRGAVPSGLTMATSAVFHVARELARIAAPRWARPPRTALPGVPHLDLAKAYRHLVELAYFESDGVRMVWGALNAVESAERAVLLPDVSRAYAQLGGALGLAGSPALATRFFRTARSVAKRASEPHAEAYVHMCTCLYMVGVGRWDAVLRSTEECQRLAERTFDAVTWGNAQIVRFWMHYYRGESVNATRAANDLQQRAARAGQAQQEGWALCSLGLLALQAGAPGDAIKLFEEARALQPSSDDTFELIRIQSGIALARLQTGDLEGATTAVRLAVARTSGVRQPTNHGTSGAVAAAVEAIYSLLARAPGDAELRALARESMIALGRYRRVFPIAAPSYFRWRAHARTLAGDRRGAARDLRRGLRSAESLKMRPDADTIREAIAQFARVTSAPRAEAPIPARSRTFPTTRRNS